MTDTKPDPKSAVTQPAPGRPKSTAVSSPPAVRRPDWQLFCSLNGLQQKAGVPVGDLPKLVCKELTDNALDAAEADGRRDGCDLGFVGDDGLWVGGPGTIPGTPAQIAEMFSVSRELTSTKAYRRPGRGALGNGTRVVAGAVIASGGTLTVCTGGRRLTLAPSADGTTAVAADEPAGREAPAGYTRVEVTFGPRVSVGYDALGWGERAVELAAVTVRPPVPKPSIHWHTADSFADLLKYAVPGTTAADVVRQFDGLSGPKLTAALDGLKWEAAAVGRSPAATTALFRRMCALARDLKPRTLGRVGDVPGWGRPVRDDTSTLTLPDGHRVPVVIEAWARGVDADDEPVEDCGLTLCVNRTPATGGVWLDFGDKVGKKPQMRFYAGGVQRGFPAKKGPPVEVLVNVQAPYMPILDDSKEPDLSSIALSLAVAVMLAVKKAQHAGRTARPAAGGDQKSVILAALPAAIARVSVDHTLPYSLRRLFYAVRPGLIERCGQEPGYDWFARVVGEHEDEHGDFDGLYRDSRGILYHPYEGRELPVGTRTVARYSRPPLLFNKVVFVEKEGLFPLLREARFPERHDCALVTCKGFTSRALSDLLGAMQAGADPLTVYAVHDADGPGTTIVQSFRDMLRERNRRAIEVIDLGLNPDQGRAMGLKPEPVKRAGTGRVPVGSHVSPADKQWLQTQRFELDTMEPEQFLAWIDAQMAAHPGKVVPNRAAVEHRVRESARQSVRGRITERLLREGGGRMTADADPDAAGWVLHLRPVADPLRLRDGGYARPRRTRSVVPPPGPGVTSRPATGRARPSARSGRGPPGPRSPRPGR